MASERQKSCILIIFLSFVVPSSVHAWFDFGTDLLNHRIYHRELNSFEMQWPNVNKMEFQLNYSSERKQTEQS